MKKFKVILFAFISLFLVGNSFAYKELLIEDRGGKPIRVIKVILDGQDFVVTSLASTGGDTIDNLVKKVGGDSGINGTFFCPASYDYCGGITHSNFERIFLGNGEKYSASRPDTSIRMIFGFDKEGNPFMAQNKLTDHDAGLNMNMNSDKIDDFEFGMSNYTVLLIEGKNVVDVNSINFDTAMKTSRINRNFICSTKDGSTIYMGVVGSVTIPELATYVQNNFSCHNALALDAGGSEAMVYDGNVFKRGRKIMDAFVVVDRETYIKLTGYTPMKKNEYIPENDYELSKNDMKTVEILDSLLKKLVKQEGSNFLSTEKSAIRAAYSSDKFKNNYQRKAIFHELLIRLFTIDKL